MAAVSITVDDLRPFAPGIDEAKALAMIEDALALAARVAPCILTDAFEHDGAAKAILRGAILRWNDTGTGAVTQQAAGPFSQTIDTRQDRKSLFWPSEIKQLQELCGSESSEAFAIDTVSAMPAASHADTCALWFGATYCSCGAILTGDYPLWGA